VLFGQGVPRSRSSQLALKSQSLAFSLNCGAYPFIVWFEVAIQLLSQLFVVVGAICRVWQTFIQASDFFPAINDECIFLVKWFCDLEIFEFPFDFFQPVVPRFSFYYLVISRDKWLRF